MAGKNTAGNIPHPSREGRQVKDISIEAEDWSRLEGLLERSITAEEKVSIGDALSLFASMREDYESDHVAAQDVKATLRKISMLPDEEIHLAISNCDSWTEERLIRALWRMGEKKKFLPADHAPAKWKAAAMLASAEFPNDRGGSRVKWYREPFARYAISLWKEMGGKNNAIWEFEGKFESKVAPLVAFATCLLALIEADAVTGPPGYSTVAKMLRKVVA